MNNEGIFGGTGLLGSEAAKQLIERGHEVTSIALPPLPAGAVLPPEMKIEYDNYLEMTDDEVRAYMKGCEGFIFAAGVDERVEGPPQAWTSAWKVRHLSTTCIKNTISTP